MIKQFRDKSINELQALVANWKAELLALRFQQATGQLEKPHKFRELKISVARALTIINEKQRNGEVASKEKIKVKPTFANVSKPKVEKLALEDHKMHAENELSAPVEHKETKHKEVKHEAKHETKHEEPKASKTKEVKVAHEVKHEPKHAEHHEEHKSEAKKTDATKEPATAAQISFMKKLKIEFDEKTITKKQAMMAISKAKKSQASKGAK